MTHPPEPMPIEKCPNPECGDDCSIEAWDSLAKMDVPDGYFQITCSTCDYHAPRTTNLNDAIRLHNLICRPTAPWLDAAAREWLVWSNEHGAWWGPNSSGYRHKVEQAGRYTFAEALSHCRSRSVVPDGLPPELPVPSPELKAIISRHAGGK